MRSLLTWLLAAVLLATGCGSTDATAPPDINYGRDLCTQCGMIIMEARFATAYRSDDGTEKAFDDLGGMVLHLRATGDDPDPSNVWVHDYETEEWIGAGTAFYVPTASVATPMGHGILAFATRERAEAFAADLGAAEAAITVNVDDDTVGVSPDDSAPLAITITDANEAPTVALSNTTTTLSEGTDTTSAIKVADITVSDDIIGTITNITDQGDGDDPQQSPDYARIVNDRHLDRVAGLLDPGGGGRNYPQWQQNF